MKVQIILNTFLELKVVTFDFFTLTVECYDISDTLPCYFDNHVEFSKEDDLNEYYNLLIKTGWKFNGILEDDDEIEEVF